MPKPTLNSSTFGYLQPTDTQMVEMATVRDAVKRYADTLDVYLPDGPDKTYTLRKLREVAMWANIAITRQPDGSPRVEVEKGRLVPMHGSGPDNQ